MKTNHKEHKSYTPDCPDCKRELAIWWAKEWEWIEGGNFWYDRNTSLYTADLHLTRPKACLTDKVLSPEGMLKAWRHAELNTRLHINVRYGQAFTAMVSDEEDSIEEVLGDTYCSYFYGFEVAVMLAAQEACKAVKG